MKIFIVSIKGSPRRSKITADLEAVGLPFEFFDAVDARDGVPLKYQKRINRNRAKIRLLRTMTDEEFGCALSHALLYEKIVRENISDVIILEDDAILTADFVKIVKNNTLKKSDIDMAFLYHNECFVRKKQYFLNGFAYQKLPIIPNRYNSMVEGTVAYYVNLPVARFLHRVTKTVSYVADYPAFVCDKFNAVAFLPLLVEHPPPNSKKSYINRTNMTGIANKTWKLKVRFSILYYFCNRRYYGSFWNALRSHFGFMKKFFKFKDDKDIHRIS